MMDGLFGGYTRWAVVFLIIFVLFFLLVPGYAGYTAAAATPCSGYGMYDGYESGYGY
ncbi:hypothetical protein [Alicyclobacillus pomorum]|jgi:hypothetical protein|uniref:hypothetical protein n=1 Tax=Alicyclobacillus pomorum TaxID=204470 RepID=UPI00040C1459|nr:hypothetical protein [Alicyclobacillus pomorum]